ncbi:MAG: BrnT family toxin [Xanthomonadaceae bacterium]|nr:BrnT family toxin [Xanthomonadaceae bacterium]
MLLGLSAAGRLLTVVYTLRGDNVRLISARRATRKEERSYAQ